MSLVSFKGKLVLASASPRRQQILKELFKIPFSVEPSLFEENLDKNKFTCEEYVKMTAIGKAMEVFHRKFKDTNIMIVSADTIVVLDDKVLEKPLDSDQAKKMLLELSGKSHIVYTAVALLYSFGNGEHKLTSFVEKTTVYFGELAPEMIDSYLQTGEAMDKAGGYGYQSLGAFFVDRIDGCYYNVVGLPVRRLAVELAKFNH